MPFLMWVTLGLSTDFWTYFYGCLYFFFFTINLKSFNASLNILLLASKIGFSLSNHQKNAENVKSIEVIRIVEKNETGT